MKLYMLSLLLLLNTCAGLFSMKEEDVSTSSYISKRRELTRPERSIEEYGALQKPFCPTKQEDVKALRKIIVFKWYLHHLNDFRFVRSYTREIDKRQTKRWPEDWPGNTWDNQLRFTKFLGYFHRYGIQIHSDTTDEQFFQKVKDYFKYASLGELMATKAAIQRTRCPKEHKQKKS